MSGTTSYHAGVAAEDCVARHYVGLGRPVLERRWRGKGGDRVVGERRCIGEHQRRRAVTQFCGSLLVRADYPHLNALPHGPVRHHHGAPRVSLRHGPDHGRPHLERLDRCVQHLRYPVRRAG